MSVVLWELDGRERLLGGGDIRWVDRLRDNDACTSKAFFFECDSARCGIAGASRDGAVAEVRVPVVVADRFEVLPKKSFASVSIGVIGVTGDDESMDELSADIMGVLRKLRSMVEKSESLLEPIEAPEEPLSEEMSGAVRAWTFVVEINSVGREFKLRSIYLMLFPRTGVESSSLFARFFRVRLVKALASAMVVEAMIEEMYG